MNDKNLTPAALVALLAGEMDNFVAASTPGGIEAQEAQGQADFVATQTLPTECPREDLENMGFVFGEEADDIFTYVQFPEGWTKEATSHSMWSDLKDSAGNVRASIFYKAAFYDRSAHIHLTKKVSYQQNYDDDSFVQYYVYESVAGEENKLFETDRVKVVRYSDEYWDVEGAAAARAREWIEEHYPDYDNPLAYWD